MKRVYVYGEETRYGNYRLAVEAAGGTVRFGRSDRAEADALLLPGGGDLEPWRYGQPNRASRGLEPERDAAELALLARFTAAGKPVLGICRGFQVINVFFGGTLVQDIPHHSAQSGRDLCHAAWPACPETSRMPGGQGAPAAYNIPEGTPAALAQRALQAYPIVNSAHHQAVDRLGEGLCLLQAAPDGVPEAFAHKTLPVWGVQWHPERLRHRSSAFFRAFLDV